MGWRDTIALRLAPDLNNRLQSQEQRLGLLMTEALKARRLRERLADLELWEEDLNWERLGPGGELDMPESTRQDRVRRSRRMYRSDPNALRIIQLYTDYVVGSGLSVNEANSPVVVHAVSARPIIRPDN